MFTMENTEGFTKEQLGTLNQALQMLKSRYPSADESNLSDAISNAVIADERENTIEKLFRRAHKRMHFGFHQ